MSEPHIIINGIPLTEGQAMAVRVAVTSFRSEMQMPGALGNDEHGIAMAAGYSMALRSVQDIMLQPLAPPSDQK